MCVVEVTSNTSGTWALCKVKRDGVTTWNWVKVPESQIGKMVVHSARRCR